MPFVLRPLSWLLPLSSEYGTYKTVKARFWSWLSGGGQKQTSTHITPLYRAPRLLVESVSTDSLQTFHHMATKEGFTAHSQQRSKPRCLVQAGHQDYSSHKPNEWETEALLGADARLPPPPWTLNPILRSSCWPYLH